jgi:hypothetical protein
MLQLCVLLLLLLLLLLLQTLAPGLAQAGAVAELVVRTSACGLLPVLVTAASLLASSSR